MHRPLTRIAVVLALAGLIASTPAASATGSDSAPDPAATWDLTDLYPSDAAWAQASAQVRGQMQQLDRFAGTLGRDAQSLFTALDEISRLQRDVARLNVYASLKGDENVKVASNQERRLAAQNLNTEIAAHTAWLAPEIVAIGAQQIAEFEQQSPPLRARFDFFLDNTLRSRARILGTEAEGVLAAAGDVLSQPEVVFTQIVDGELPFGSVTLSDGTTVRVDQAAYERWRQAPVRADREAVFRSFFGSLKAFEGSVGATLNFQVLTEELDARVRHYPNALADAVFADNMPESVYRTLVAQASAGLPTLYRYLALRKSVLGIADQLKYSDLYAPMFRSADASHYTLDDMKRIALEVTTASYGPAYADLLRQGLNARWMHLYPQEGKANGAYMNGSAYDVHPYLLFNNHDDYQSLRTFLHEWGHAVHTLLTRQYQPYEKSNYSTFIAETASIGNEMLLNDYLIAHASSDAQRIFLLGQDLELIRQTFFRQAMFAEFQLAIHEEVEKGASLSGQRLSELYCGVARRYYGEAQGVTQIDPAYCVEWEYIPHFYRGFYVYQYATSIVGAAKLASDIAHEGAPARDRFLSMLKAGGSDYPFDLYRRAGIDMSTPEPYQALIARMNHDLDQIEALRH